MEKKNEQQSDITGEKLIEAGWERGSDPVYPFKKKIPNRNPLNASEDSDIKLVVHGMYNSQTFAVVLPDGGMLNFVANSMKELEEFESKIDFYDPPF